MVKKIGSGSYQSNDSNFTPYLAPGPEVVKAIGRLLPSGEILPVFHFINLFEFLLSKRTIINNQLKVVIRSFEIHFSVCPPVPVIHFIRNAICEIVDLTDPGFISRKLGFDRTWKDRVKDAMLIDIMRPIYFKLKYPDYGFLEFNRMYSGVYMTRGARILADLLLEGWTVFSMKGFGNLRVVINPSKIGYDLVKAEFPIIAQFETMDKPFFDSGLHVVPASLSRLLVDFDASLYYHRKTLPRLPAIGDFFFYEYFDYDYVYTLLDDRVNVLSMSLGYFLGTRVTDREGTPIGHLFEVLVRTVTTDASGKTTISEKVEVISGAKVKTSYTDYVDESVLRSIYEYDTNYNLTILNDGLTYISFGNTSMLPTANLGFKGNPSEGAGSGGGPVPSGSAGPSGQGQYGEQPTGTGGMGAQPPVSQISKPSRGQGGVSAVLDTLNRGLSVFVENSDAIVAEANRLASEGTAQGNSELQRQASIVREASDKQRGALSMLMDVVSAVGPPPVRMAVGAFKAGQSIAGAIARSKGSSDRQLGTAGV